MRQAERRRIYAEIQASEPRQNSKNPLQLIEKLSVAGFQQASPPVQMQRKRRASEPRIKAESVWNVAECKCALEALLAGVSTKRAAEWLRHLNRNKTRKIHCNTLKNFPLQGFNKHHHRFRCSGKGEYLNLAVRQNQAAKPLTTNVLQDFQQLCPRFRSQTGLERRGMQMCPVGASCRGIHQTRDNTAHASEPRRNPKNPLQFIEKLSVARF